VATVVAVTAGGAFVMLGGILVALSVRRRRLE
jgi:hypothetical protein